jgi:protein-tyrosine-phosphatase
MRFTRACIGRAVPSLNRGKRVAATPSPKSHGLTIPPVSRGRPSTRLARARTMATVAGSARRVWLMPKRAAYPNLHGPRLRHAARDDARRAVSDRPFNVLFLCTGNSARSIMAEAILNKLGAGKFHGYSAGSQPKGQIHPETAQLLQSLGYDTSGFSSNSWGEFAKPNAPPFDFVVTVCDNAAGEVCPVWPGQPMTAHYRTWRFRLSALLSRSPGRSVTKIPAPIRSGA